MKYPFVSVIIPSRNEEKFIGKCLDSLVANDYPKDKLEILVVDGKSEDNTRVVIESYSAKYPFIKIIENPRKTTPISMNLGVKNAKGEIITICGAHSTYDKDYISKSVLYLEEYGADDVGGILKTLPAENTYQARAIAFALSSFFGTGGAAFRVGSDKPRFTDTVFGGCFRREVFKKIGFYNENLTRSQDMEFSLRLKNAGGKILLAPDIVTTYYPKSTLPSFFAHNVKDGIWAVLPIKFGSPLFKPRHLIPFIFVAILTLSLVLGIFLTPFLYLFFGFLVIYLATASFFSLKIASREKDFVLLPFLAIAFFIRHFAYGIGSFIGTFKLIF